MPVFFLVYENGMVCAVIEKDAESSSVEVGLVVHSHRQIGGEQTRPGCQDQEETHSAQG